MDIPSPQDQNAKKSMGLIIFLVAFLSGIGPFAIDTYLPVLPAIGEDLETNLGMVQFTISGFLIGVAIFPMILTPLSDAFGRKPVLYGCMIAFIVFSICCAFATTIEELIFFRIFQAAAAGTVMTTSRTVIADYYSGNALSRATSQVLIVFTIAPVIAPLAGGYIFQFGGWQAVFILLAIIGIILLLFVALLPESLPKEKRNTYRILPLIQDYIRLIKDHGSLRFLLVAGFSSAFFFAMLGASAFIFIEFFNTSEVDFAWIFSVISLTALVANWINTKIVMRVGFLKMNFYAFYALALVIMCFGLFLATGIANIFTIWAIMGSLMGLFHLFLANTTAGLMEYAPKNAGAASAVLSLFRFIGGTLGSAGFGLLGVIHPWGFLVILTICGILIGLSLFMIKRR